MNIVHLSKSDDRGAFIAAYRFHKQLMALGHNSIMLVERKTTLDSDVVEVKLNLVGTVINKFYKFISAYIIKRRTDPRFSFFNYFEDFALPVRAIKNSLPFTPDIICVHWVTGFVNTRVLFRLNEITVAPVVWRFNDLNAFTGGCHYPNGCTNYFAECGNCPALFSKKLQDRSYYNFQKKIKWISKTNITFVSSTSEIDQQLNNSAIARHSKTKFIMLSCSNKFLHPHNDKNAAALSLNLPPGRKIIFFGAQSFSEARKGFKEFMQSLKILKTIVSESVAREILLVYATKFDDMEIDWIFDSVRIPFLKNDEELAKAYQAATLFVSPSLEDAGPMMIAESLLCGTPVVAFDIGLARDAVINNVTGFIVPKGDVATFARRMKDTLSMDQQKYAALSGSCYDKAISMFSISREMNEYEQLFNHLLKK